MAELKTFNRSEVRDRLLRLQSRLWRIRSTAKAVREYTEVNTTLVDPEQDVYAALQGVVDQLDQLHLDMDPDQLLQREVTHG